MTDIKKRRILVRPSHGGPWCVCDAWPDVEAMLDGSRQRYEFELRDMTDAEVEALGDFPGW